MIDDKLTQEELNAIVESELGPNALRLLSCVMSLGSNRIFIDLGVETGKTSKILLHQANERNNTVVGVDPIPSAELNEIRTNPKYVFLQADSVEVGRQWSGGPVDLVMVDTIHAKEQVLCELFYWWDHLREGGIIAFHDTQWAGSIIRPPHPSAGKGLGTSGKGFDVYGGVAWETPDKAVLRFFDIPDLNHSNEWIDCAHDPASYGMTFIHKKKHKDFKQTIKDWDEIFRLREFLMTVFLNPNQQSQYTI